MKRGRGAGRIWGVANSRIIVIVANGIDFSVCARLRTFTVSCILMLNSFWIGNLNKGMMAYELSEGSSVDEQLNEGKNLESGHKTGVLGACVFADKNMKVIKKECMFAE